MKDSAYLINMARGGLVDTAALIEALQNHQLAGRPSTPSPTKRATLNAKPAEKKYQNPI